MMRRLAAWIILAAMVLTPGALSDSVAPTNVGVEREYVADLNGDGAEETYAFIMREDDFRDAYLWLAVTDAEGGKVEYPTLIANPSALWLARFDGPALVATGVDLEGAPCTYVLRYTPGRAIQPFIFPADAAGPAPENLFTPYGRGVISTMIGDTITLEASVDVLGTRLAQCRYVLCENARFAFDDGLWTFNVNTTSPDAWKDPLVTNTDLKYIDQNDEYATLPEDTRLLITATDKSTFARFVTQDGISGILEIVPADDEDVYHYTVGNMEDYEALSGFEYDD